MERKHKLFYFIGGIALGMLIMAAVWLFFGGRTDNSDIADGNGSPTQAESKTESDKEHSSESLPSHAETPEPTDTEEDGTYSRPSSPTEPPRTKMPVNEWDSTAVYIGGDTVSYQGRRYRARWWTQGERPGGSDVWEDLGITDGSPVQPSEVSNTPIDASKPQDTKLTDFKVVGYYPDWAQNKLNMADFGVLTHICYAFAIPTAEGGLRDLENPDAAAELIRAAHKNGAKVLLSVGGWSYNDVPLEPTFMEATSSSEKTLAFAESIIEMCGKYGFDGVDMDWEHPRTDGTSARQYEELMLILSEKLHKNGKLLTAAVLSGVTADGNVYYDAAAHTNAVLNAVDFINVMAYDGGDGERHSQYDFAVDCGTYWKDTRGLPSHKVVLGVPFYARPSWAGYGAILAEVPNAWSTDSVTYNGMEVFYNGVETIKKKTRYAKENLGGVMIWELTQDAQDREKSLLQAIGDAAEQP